MTYRHFSRTTAILSLLSATAATAQPAPWPDGAANLPEAEPAFAEQTEAPAQLSDFVIMREDIGGGLVHPWAITALPDGGGYLVTERGGDLHHMGTDGTLSDPISGVPEVFAERQGGLLDIALAPDFADSRVLYLTYAKPMGDGLSSTAAARAVLSDDMTGLSEVEDIFVQSPPSATPMHYGSRVVPTEDHIYITTGEHSSEAERFMAQVLAGHYGKVIRLMPDGSVPADNPFLETQAALPEIFSTGHRNVQGAAVNAQTGDLWVIEHGPAGGDEVNLVAAGANYGWPVVTYGINYSGTPVGSGFQRHAPLFTEPRYYWDPVIAPGGMEFYDGAMFPEWQGDILVSGLVASALVRLDIDGDIVTGEERLLEGIGRVRDVAVDDDGAVLLVLDTEDSPVFRLTRGE